MSILALDVSLNSSGYAYHCGSTFITGTILPNGLKGLSRLSFINNKVKQLLDIVQPTMVVYEGYSMGSVGRTFDIGELGGVLKLYLWRAGIDILLVPPKILKKYIVGSGNARKEQISEALKAIYHVDIKQNDEADAYGLLLLGEEYKSNTEGHILFKKCEFIRGKKCNRVQTTQKIL